MDAIDDALRVIASLNDANVDYVVVGGVAMNLRGLIRATEDLHNFLRPDPANIARLRNALKRVWSDPAIDQITAEDLCRDYPEWATARQKAHCIWTSSPDSARQPPSKT